jgi:hypothetical protein
MSKKRHFDMLIVVTPADCERLMPLYPRLAANFDNGDICFIGAPEVGKLVIDGPVSGHAKWVDENSVIPFDEVHGCMSRRLSTIIGDNPLPRGITGWYYQQFLKMQYSSICKDEYYLAWDGDTVPCRKINMFSTETDTPYLDLKYEYHPDYFDTMARILPGLKKAIEKSFISEHMLFRCDIMRKLIRDIESNESIPGNRFWEKIINAIAPEKIYDSAFSEFETYGTYVADRYLDAYKLRDWHSFRLGASFFDINNICERDFKWLAVDFDAISFEKGQSVAEGVGGYFDNPDVQKKISAKKLLQEIQVGFKDAYKEVWDDDLSAAEANYRKGGYYKNKNDNTDFMVPAGFLREEVRDGFLVSELMKRTWAAHLKILNKLQVLFDKYELTYYAEVGTALGAYRHKGFVPWDDDIDISMLRKDYMVLLEHADEIDDDLVIRSVYNSDTYMNFHAVCTHKADTLKWDKDRMNEYYGCPFICYIDIFPLDYIPKDPQALQIFKELYYVAYKLVHDCKAIEDNYLGGKVCMLNMLEELAAHEDIQISEDIRGFIKELEALKQYLLNYLGEGVLFKPDIPLRKQLCLCVEKVAQMVEEKDSDGVDYCPKIPISGYINPRNKLWYEGVQELPFEFIKVNTPLDCAGMLESQYGPDFMTPIRGTAAHDYPFFREEITVLINGDTGDAFTGTIKGELAVPDDWKAVLVDTSGNLKHVIVYGISATDILNNGSTGIKHVRKYLEKKEAEADNCIVIMLAPEGLLIFMETCDLAMEEDYRRLLSDLEKMENVIFDDHADSDEIAMIVSISDEYYGDRCRLMELCSAAGLPVTLQEYT